MQEVINEKVSVVTVFDRQSGVVMPKRLKWQGKYYEIETLGYHHTVRAGRKLLHIFSVANSALAFRLRFDTETLHWFLEEVSDGCAT